MSYELGALHHPQARGRIYRTANKSRTPRVIARTKNPRSPFMGLRVHQYGAVHAPYQLPTTMPVSMYDEGTLGFSLKPPKAVRKAFKAVKKAVTLKRVLTAGAIVAGAALIPGALPLLAKGAVGAGKLALGTGRLAAKGVVGAARFGAKNIRSAAGILRGAQGTGGAAPQPEEPAPTVEAPPISPGDTWGTAVEPRQPLPPAPLEPSAPTMVPGTSYGGGMDMSADSGDTESPAKPAQAGIGGGAIALGIGAALLLVAASRRRR